MSNLRFFFITELYPARKGLFCLSLKTANQLFSILTVFLLVIAFVFEYTYTEQKLLIIFKNLAYSFLIVISCSFILKSTKNLTYFDAYVGYLILCWNSVYHISCLFVNLIFGLKFFALNLDNLFGVNNISYNKELLTFWLPQIIFILYEFYFIWICYSYTKNLCEGNDALVDGQNFDKYFENFASSNSTPKNSERSCKINL